MTADWLIGAMLWLIINVLIQNDFCSRTHEKWQKNVMKKVGFSVRKMMYVVDSCTKVKLYTLKFVAYCTFHIRKQGYLAMTVSLYNDHTDNCLECDPGQSLNISPDLTSQHTKCTISSTVCFGWGTLQPPPVLIQFISKWPVLKRNWEREGLHCNFEMYPEIRTESRYIQHYVL